MNIMRLISCNFVTQCAVTDLWSLCSPFFGSVFLTNILLRKVVSNLRWAGHVACMGDRRGAYWVLMGRP